MLSKKLPAFLLLCVSVFLFSCNLGSKEDKECIIHFMPPSYQEPQPEEITISIGYGSSIGFYNLEEKYHIEGYDFLEWRLNDRYGEKVTADFVVTKDLYLYAVYTPKIYTATFISTYDNQTYCTEWKFGSFINLLSNTIEIPRHMEFLGWAYKKDTQADFNASSVIESLYILVPGDVVLYTVLADKTGTTFTIVYNDYNPETDTTSEPLITSYTDYSTYIRDNIFLPELSRPGYTFNGWKNTDGEITSFIDLNRYDPSTPIEVTAAWSINSYRINFKSTQGSGYYPEFELNFGETLILPENPFTAPTGYSFLGWQKKDSDEILSAGSEFTVVAETIYFNAVWTENPPHKITYVLNGGENSISNPKEYKESETTRFYSPEQRKGYVFDGWYLEDSFNTKIQSISRGEYTEDLTLYAKWRETVYNITYGLNNGTNNPDNPDTYKASLGTVKLQPATKDYYLFDHWELYPINTLIEEISVDSFSSSDIYVTAVYKPIEYTITYNNTEDSDFNQYSALVSYNIESSSYYFPKPYKPGYRFVDWYKDADFTSSITSIPNKNPVNLTLYAKWELRSDIPYKVEHYTQNIDDDNYTLYRTKSGYYGKPFNETSASALTLTGFTAKAFDQEIIKTDGSTVVKIYYDRNIYSVDFLSNDSVYKTITERYGKEYELPDPPSNNGYRFTGWKYGSYKYSPKKIVSISKNDTYSASWEKRKYYYWCENIDNPYEPWITNKSFTVEDKVPVTLPVNPVSNNLQVIAFYANSDFSGEPITGWSGTEVFSLFPELAEQSPTDNTTITIQLYAKTEVIKVDGSIALVQKVYSDVPIQISTSSRSIGITIPYSSSPLNTMKIDNSLKSWSYWIDNKLIASDKISTYYDFNPNKYGLGSHTLYIEVTYTTDDKKEYLYSGTWEFSVK